MVTDREWDRVLELQRRRAPGQQVLRPVRRGIAPALPVVRQRQRAGLELLLAMR
jgi:hypothetical protein